MTALSNPAVFRLLLALVILSPLPLGSHRPWAWSLLGLAVGILLLFWAAAIATGKARIAIPARHFLWAALPMAVAILWGIVQTLGYVPGNWVHPLWPEARQALGQPVVDRISLDPTLTRTALFRLVTYVGVFWLAVQLGRERNRARTAIVAVALVGTAYAAYGLSVYLRNIDRILWLKKWAYRDDLTSTFVNRNAYGAYAGIGILCCTALIFHAVRHSRRPRQIYDWVEGLLVKLTVFLTGTILMGAALLLSHSRGAFLSTAFGLLVLMSTVMAARMIRPRTAIFLIAVLICALASIMGISGDGTAQRLVETIEISPDEARPYLYRGTLEAIADAPWTGTGLGAFLPTFRMYRDTSLSAPLVWDFAHNIYLETALDLGIPVAVLLFLSVAVVLGTCIWGLRARRRDHIYPALAIAVTALIGSHGIVDFSVQMPSIAVTFAFLLGIGYAQSWPSADLTP